MNYLQTSKAFFDAKYRSNSDPWAFATSGYEQDRYAAIVAALDHRRYRRAFEPGCSIGVLTSGLAPLCDELIGTDISPAAVGYARDRCSIFPNVTILCRSLPDFIPDGPFDLIVFSEVGYYLEEAALCFLALTLAEKLSSSGVLLAAHWLGHSEDHLLSGDEVHRLLRDTPGLALDHQERHAGFRLDRWVKP